MPFGLELLLLQISLSMALLACLSIDHVLLGWYLFPMLRLLILLLMIFIYLLLSDGLGHSLLWEVCRFQIHYMSS